MPDASVIIITRNRKELAGRAIESALAQEGGPEVVVVDDASDDGSDAALQAAYPQVKFHRSPTRAGYIVLRNLAVRMCSGPAVFSIDDDAVFDDPETIRKTLPLFQEPRVGAVAVPFVNCYQDGRQEAMLPPVADDGSIRISNTFIGTAFAVRRDVFLNIGGFQELLFHWGEETEYSQRLLGAGYVVALGSSGLIRHFPERVGKYTRQVVAYIPRNGLLLIWFNAPGVLLVPLLLAQSARLLVWAIRHPHEWGAAWDGFWMAFKTICRSRQQRRPLPLATYRLWLWLRRERPVLLENVRAKLPDFAAPPTVHPP